MAIYKVREEVDLGEMYEGMDIHPLTLLLLNNRGITDKEEAKVFLNPKYERDIGNPFDIFGVQEAVTRILSAIENEEKIVIYSDYDCDGIPGGVLLREFFQTIGYPVGIYIPHRHNEGYGIHKHALDALKDEEVKLMITVDLAITNIDEVEYAKSIGIDCIVTDHHLPIELEEKGEIVQKVPNAVAVINSKQHACTYEDDMLCGCAVAWKLSCALLHALKNEKDSKGHTYNEVVKKVQALPVGYEKWLLDLVAVSTVADMVPLVKENRALAYFGLKVLQKTKRPALNQLFFNQGIAKEKLTEEDIAFTIAPRVNAASRMGIPMQAHDMLYEKNMEKAREYLDALETLNTERKEGVKTIVDGISYDHDVYKEEVVVVGDFSWGPGILGLIAQKIVDETNKPVFVWGQGEDKGHVKGSCRSAQGINIVSLMAYAKKEEDGGVFAGFGGHEQAGGFSVSIEKLPLLQAALNEAIKHVPKPDQENGDVFIDALLSYEDVNEMTLGAVQALAPFGVGNPKPLFAFVEASPKSVRRFGKKNEHIEVIYAKEKGEVKAIQFFVSPALEEKLKKEHKLVAHVEKSYFRGKGELRLRIVDVM